MEFFHFSQMPFNFQRIVKQTIFVFNGQMENSPEHSVRLEIEISKFTGTRKIGFWLSLYQKLGFNIYSSNEIDSIYSIAKTSPTNSFFSSLHHFHALLWFLVHSGSFVGSSAVWKQIKLFRIITHCSFFSLLLSGGYVYDVRLHV